jgi:hypothetical protein
MSSIIQRKAAFATHVGSGSVAVTLDSPISAGSTLVIACAVVQTDGGSNALPNITVQDDLTNGYSPTAYASSGSGFFANTYQGSAIPQAGARTYTLSYTAQTGGSAYTYLAGICVYELSGVSSSFSNESAHTGTSGVHAPSSLSATISGLSGGTYGNLLVSIYAGIFTSTLTDAQAVAAGSGWTLDGRDAVNGTFSPIAIVFESQLVGSPSNPAATVSSSTNSTAIDDTLLVAAYSLTSAISGGGSGGGGSTDTDIFLGSVRVLGSAPSGQSNPFLGTVKVISSPPSGRTNPYLGSVVIGTPGANNTNPSLGEVVVVTEVPADAFDEFWGTVSEA